MQQEPKRDPGRDTRTDEDAEDREGPDLDPEPLAASPEDIPRAFPSGEADEPPTESGAAMP